MTRILTLLSLLLISSTSFADCPNEKFKALTRQSEEASQQSKQLNFTAQYLYEKISERGGPYFNNQTLGLLSLETRNAALRSANQAAKLQMEASNLLLSCIEK